MSDYEDSDFDKIREMFTIAEDRPYNYDNRKTILEGFLYLKKLLPDHDGDFISAAEHDIIFINASISDLVKANVTQEDINYLDDCGFHMDEFEEGLCKYV